MKLTSVLSEAWRNTITGASHAVALALAALLTIGGLATAETLTINALVHRAHEYIDAGGDITVIATPPGPNGGHYLDGRACEALATLPGIMSAGALRSSEQTLTPAALPNTSYTTVEASPGLRTILNVNGSAATPGLWLPGSVAETLAADATSQVALVGGETAHVSGVFDYPSDGRPARLANTIFTPTPATERFDECWVRSWPTNTGIAELANSLLVPDAPSDARVTTSRLNPTLSADFDGATQFAQRITAPAAPIALAAGIILGVIAIRTRRRAIAYHRHIGVGIAAQTLQVVIETLAWALAAAALATVVVGAIATPAAFSATWQLGIRVVAAGLTGTIVGAVVGLATIRESSLFRYVKE